MFCVRLDCCLWWSVRDGVHRYTRHLCVRLRHVVWTIDPSRQQSSNIPNGSKLSLRVPENKVASYQFSKSQKVTKSDSENRPVEWMSNTEFKYHQRSKCCNLRGGSAGHVYQWLRYQFHRWRYDLWKGRPTTNPLSSKSLSSLKTYKSQNTHCKCRFSTSCKLIRPDCIANKTWSNLSCPINRLVRQLSAWRRHHAALQEVQVHTLPPNFPQREVVHCLSWTANMQGHD